MNFNKNVWALLAKIPKGKVTTYKIIGTKLNTKAYRAIGTACHNNPDPKIPCYRVVKSDGTIGICHHGDNCYTKRLKKLKLEGVIIKDDKIVNFSEKLYWF